MPRRARESKGGVIYHVLNRGTGGLKLFAKVADFEAFIKMMGEADEAEPIRLLGFCLMHTHWHMVLWPRKDGELSRHLRWLCTTHVRRHHQHYQCHGTGHLYQGRFRSFPVQDDDHFLSLLQYVERNPLRARMVERAQNWPWSSLAMRGTKRGERLLAEWPVERPRNWNRIVNTSLDDRSLCQVMSSMTRDRPLGDATWTKRIARRLGLESTLRPRGRPWRK